MNKWIDKYKNKISNRHYDHLGKEIEYFCVHKQKKDDYLLFKIVFILTLIIIVSLSIILFF